MEKFRKVDRYLGKTRHLLEFSVITMERQMVINSINSRALQSIRELSD